jgi:hypothetical protein
MSNHKFWIILVTAALFIIGCADKTPTVAKKPVKETNTTIVPVPQKVYKKGELTEVQDGNFSSAYMYPEGKKKQEKVVKVAEAETVPTIATTNTMNKEECVSMIGQAKFDKYTQMFGNEASSIKRCAMLKAMN